MMPVKPKSNLSRFLLVFFGGKGGDANDANQLLPFQRLSRRRTGRSESRACFSEPVEAASAAVRQVAQGLRRQCDVGVAPGDRARRVVVVHVEQDDVVLELVARRPLLQVRTQHVVRLVWYSAR